MSTAWPSGRCAMTKRKTKTTPKPKTTTLLLIHPQNSFCKVVSQTTASPRRGAVRPWCPGRHEEGGNTDRAA